MDGKKMPLAGRHVVGALIVPFEFVMRSLVIEDLEGCAGSKRRPMALL